MATMQERLQAFITALGADIKSLQNGKANTQHTHPSSDITGLSAGGLSGVSAVLTSAVTNNTTVSAVLTGHTFSIPAGKTLMLQGILLFTTPAATTGAAYGIRVTQGAGANANALGSWTGEVAVATGASSGGLRNGGLFNVAAAGATLGEVLGTGVSAINTTHTAYIKAVIKNQATNVAASVNLEFRSEVNLSMVTAQVGTSAAGVII